MSEPVFNVPPVTLRLCLLLLVCYLLSLWLGVWPGTTGGRLALDVLAFRAQFAAGGGLDPALLATLPGHALLHAGFAHFGVNTGMLLAFGSAVERSLGGRVLVALAISGAIAGGLAMVALSGEAPAYLVGASDAVHAVAGAAALLMIRLGDERGRRTGFSLLGFLIGINVLLAVLGDVALVGDLRIGWQAHLGGLAAGLAIGTWQLKRVSRP
ncbi:MAG: rhomboid family intramembrane serine protease [Alphaproteobacteria bacterium]|jgi:membrane associated rhomboid family serine protease|nr:rhomboid family intramembrane serine protease [Alphaproteobacteria bacterium]